MKHFFLKSLYSSFRRDVAGVVEELYASRYITCLTPEQDRAVDVCRFLCIRMDIFRNVYGCCRLIEDILNDDEIADHIDMMMSESPRVGNWPLVKILAPTLVHICQSLQIERVAS